MKLVLCSLPGHALLLFCFLAIGTPVPAFGHGGGLDGYGCHHNRKAGGYHCHRGPLAGQAFSSKDDMLSQLKKIESPRTTKPRAEEKSVR